MNFHLSIPKTNEQYLHIECSFAVNQEHIEIFLPSWRPGRYEIANFAKNIRGFKVFNEKNPDGQISIKIYPWSMIRQPIDRSLRDLSI